MSSRIADPAGLLLLDKPSGPSSAAVLARVKYALRVRSAGHTGTLDPLASGMLPLVFGAATRLSQWMLSADKAYRVTAQLGQRTDTLDALGTVTHSAPVPADWSQRLAGVLAGLRGAILQVPPQYSALKVDGVRAYTRARSGESVALAAREVHIHALEVVRMDAASCELEVVCSKGTYIRTLVDDLGQALGCGAHVSALRRLWVAPFQDAPMWTLDAVLADPQAARAALLAPLAMLPQLPRLDVDDLTALRLRQGQRVGGFAACAAPGTVAVVQGGALVAVANLDAQGLLRPERVFAAG